MKSRSLINKIAIGLFLSSTLVLNVGCSNNVSSEKIIKDHRTITIDSCEYIVMDKVGKGGYAGYGFMAHKGNCKYCAKRALQNK